MIASSTSRPAPPGATSRDAVTPLHATDLSLVQAMAGRDERAVATLYDRHAPILLAHAMRLLGDQADAESVLLETFNQAWLDAHRYEPSRGAVVAWLLNMCRSRALDLLRARERRIRLIDHSLDQGDRPDVQMKDSTPDPASSVEHRERRAAVAAALAALPESQRLAIHLAFFEGLSHGEIAERLAQPLGTIKTRIRLGMQKLRDTLRVHGEEFAT